MPLNEFDKIKEKLTAKELRAKKAASIRTSLEKSRRMQKASRKRSNENTPITHDRLSDTSSECSDSSVSTVKSSLSNHSKSSYGSSTSRTNNGCRLFHKKKWNSDTAHYEKDRIKRPAEHVHGISKEEYNKIHMKGRG